eukprot:CAMPEP_0179209472 /NCGR_PEP_ID=MMETSP0796-20121207/104471_1 /TAXON_ID=73915 /ORGANISM="Pyrodinium bahamense, Strain pbaha01" /LENGTH=245 /DNA_ID=CAMNT_0020914431 /DNA_START=1 /DNA_END=737 /DNA_ORIENTATION=+
MRWGDAGITRVKGKCAKDDQEGWVTTKGNAGTVYAAASSKHYCIVQEVPLQKKFATASTEVVRVLARDEMVLAVEDPKEEAFPPEVRVRGRAISDGAVGWITVKDENVKRWSPSYKCIKATPLHESVAVEGASVVRQLEVGERAELLEGPVEQGGGPPDEVAGREGRRGWLGDHPRRRGQALPPADALRAWQAQEGAQSQGQVSLLAETVSPEGAQSQGHRGRGWLRGSRWWFWPGRLLSVSPRQ